MPDTTQEPIFKQRIYAIIFLLLVGWSAYAITNSILENRNKTPQQREAEAQEEVKREARQAAILRDEQRRQREAAAEKWQRDIRLCRLKEACEKYAKARQDCAAAGNLETCISVKMGDDDSMTGGCMNDGRVATMFPSQMPDTPTCWVHGVANFFGGF